MKKYFALVLIVITAVWMLSCSKGDAGTAGAPGPTGATGEGWLVMQFQNAVSPNQYYAGTTSTADARAREGTLYKETNYLASASLQIGTGGTGDKKRGIYWFNVSALPSNATVKKAYVTLYCNNFYGTAPQLAFYKITESWTPSEVCWSSRTAASLWTTPGGTYDSGSQGSVVTIDTGSKNYTWEVNAAAVQSWVTNSSNNYGLILRGVNEDSATQSDASLRHDDYGIAEKETRPKLTVYYTLP